MKKTTAFLAMLLMMLVLGGCGSSSDPNASQYAEYVGGLLDAVYQENYDVYMEMTGESESDAKTLYENNVQNMMDELAEYFMIATTDSELREELEELVEELFSQLSYELVSAEYSSSVANYVVTVQVTPLDFIDRMDVKISAYVGEMNAKVLNGDFSSLSTSEYNLLYAQGVMELLQETLDEMQEAEVVTVKLTFTSNSDGSVYISESDLHKVSKALIGL